MKIKEILEILEELAPISLQEDYDNAGLISGDPEAEIHQILVCLDITEEVIEEAKRKDCNLVISHHPVIFKGLKRITGQTATERIMMQSIRYGIGIVSMHTNLDNVYSGVNRVLAERLGLKNLQILRKSGGILRKLVTFSPTEHADKVRQAIFAAGAGHIGKYDQCSFNSEGSGSFRAGEGADPFVGRAGELHFEKEVRIETIFPAYIQKKLIAALIEAHPYEEVAYDIYPLENDFDHAGAGMIGEMEPKLTELEFLRLLKESLGVPVIRHSALLGGLVGKVAVCGGSGSFLISDALKLNVDFFVTADIKYHQFFEPEGRMVLADAGHFETEQFTCQLLAGYLKKKFPKFAVQISETRVNPVNYF